MPDTSALDKESLERLKLTKEIALLDRQLDTPWRDILRQLRGQFFTILNPILVVVLTFVSTYLIEVVRGRFADRRDRQAVFEVVSRDLGHFRFMSELEQEFMANNWTSLVELSPITEEYNTVITRLRQDEFKQHALIEKCWGQSAAAEYDSVMQRAKQVDAAVHGMNGETGRLLREKPPDEPKAVGVKPVSETSHRADPKIASEVAKRIESALAPFNADVKRLLATLTAKLRD